MSNTSLCSVSALQLCQCNEQHFTVQYLCSNYVCVLSNTSLCSVSMLQLCQCNEQHFTVLYLHSNYVCVLRKTSICSESMLQLCLCNEQHFTLFNIYAPTLGRLSKNGTFHSHMCSLLHSSSANGKLLILGKINVWVVGQNSGFWEGVLEMHNVGNCNDNEYLLRRF